MYCKITNTILRRIAMAQYIGFKNEKTFNPETLKKYFALNPGREEKIEFTDREEALKGWNILKNALEKSRIVEELKNSPLYVKEKD